MNIGCLLLLLLTQDQKEFENVVAKLPEPYLQLKHPYVSEDTFAFKPSPPKLNRSYLIQPLDKYGQPVGKAETVSEEHFFFKARCILSQGVYDRPSLEVPCRNAAFAAFIKILLEYDILSRDEVERVGKLYVERTWRESAYWLDEAVPGVITRADWQKLDTGEYQYPYVLTRIKLADGTPAALNEIRKRIDIEIQEIFRLDQRQNWYFEPFGQAYAELKRCGADFPEVSERQLFQLYDIILNSYYSKLGINLYIAYLKNSYHALGLPMPGQATLTAVLCENLKQGGHEPRTDLLRIFKSLGLEFPKEYAVLYRDILMNNFGAQEDIDDLVRIGGEDAPPKLWKKYADYALWRHLSKENRQGTGDATDYYHMAVEGYRHLKTLGNFRWDEKTVKELTGEMDDLSVHLRDLLAVYEMIDKDPHFYLFREKFEERAARYDEKVSNDGRDQDDGCGRRLVRFRDSIELAAYFKETEMTRQLSERISNYIAEAMFHYEIMAEYHSGQLQAWYELYESLSFTAGARSLAHHLMDAGLIVPARRFFHLGGIGQEAEEQFYGKYSDDELEKLQQEIYRTLHKSKSHP